MNGGLLGTCVSSADVRRVTHGPLSVAASWPDFWASLSVRRYFCRL
ncbi:hypothetical protein ABIE67_006501 [Streptomyces sp. V4I8]